MLYLLLLIGAFLAGVGFIFRSIAWVFGQASLPYISREKDFISNFQVPQEGTPKKTVQNRSARPAGKPVPL